MAGSEAGHGEDEEGNVRHVNPKRRTDYCRVLKTT
jgi:hypothetical protein